MRSKRVLDILRLVRENGYATMQELSERFGVSMSTIRRDIAQLVHDALVTCSKNIVMPIMDSTADRPLNFRSTVNAQAKQAMSHEAAKLVKNGCTIFIDSSSTVLPMVNMLQQINHLVIVTNGLDVVPKIQNNHVQLHIIGGEMSDISHGFYGATAENALKNFNFDFAFFSPVGITPQNYAAESTWDAASVRRVAMQQSSCSVLLFDHTKVGLTRPYNFAHLSEFQYIITDDTKNNFDTAAQVRRVHI